MTATNALVEALEESVKAWLKDEVDTLREDVRNFRQLLSGDVWDVDRVSKKWCGEVDGGMKQFSIAGQVVHPVAFDAYATLTAENARLRRELGR